LRRRRERDEENYTAEYLDNINSDKALIKTGRWA